MLDSKIADKPTGLVYSSEETIGNALREFSREHLALSRAALEENRFLKKSVLAIFSLFILVVGGGAASLYFFSIRHFDTREFSGKLEAYKTQLNSKIEQENDSLRDKYQKEIQHLYLQGKQNQRELLDFLLQLQKEQDRKIVAAEKEKLSLEQKVESLKKTIGELRSSLTRSELALLRMEEKERAVQKRTAGLEKQILEYQEYVKQLKNRLAERLSPEEKELLERDLKNDE